MASSTNIIPRSSITKVYLPYTFTFPAGTIVPAGSYFIGVECVGCDLGKVYLAEYKTGDPCPPGNMTMFRSNSWTVLPKDIEGSATYGVAN